MNAEEHRRERARLLAARDRIGNRMRWADAAREQAERRIAALAIELAEIDRQLLEAGAEVAP